jgi:hypothetical protein
MYENAIQRMAATTPFAESTTAAETTAGVATHTSGVGKSWLIALLIPVKSLLSDS